MERGKSGGGCEVYVCADWGQVLADLGEWVVRRVVWLLPFGFFRLPCSFRFFLVDLQLPLFFFGCGRPNRGLNRGSFCTDNCPWFCWQNSAVLGG